MLLYDVKSTHAVVIFFSDISGKNDFVDYSFSFLMPPTNFFEMMKTKKSFLQITKE